MKTFIRSTLMASLVLILSASVHAHGQWEPIQTVNLSTLTYKEITKFPGVSSTFITGSFDKPGLYTTHALMENGAKFPPHIHPDPRITIVTEGTMFIGEGRTFDDSKLIAFPRGSVFIVPANTPHFMYAKEGDVYVLDSGAGPSGIKFFDK